MYMGCKKFIFSTESVIAPFLGKEMMKRAIKIYVLNLFKIWFVDPLFEKIIIFSF